MSGHSLEWSRHDGGAAVAYATNTMNNIDIRAKHLLGLTIGEADRLFFAYNDRGDIERIATEIAARASEELWPEESEIEVPSMDLTKEPYATADLQDLCVLA